MSESAPELPAESEPLAGAAENARRGVVTHVTIHGERVAAIVPESLIKLVDDLMALLANDLALTGHTYVLTQAFPWARSLPSHELKAFAGGLRQAAAAGAPEATELVDGIITGWQATAEAYADYGTLAALRAPIGDYGPVPEPSAAE